MSPKWICERGGDRAAQVFPEDDLREHVTDGGECWCDPRTNEDGTIVHNALDQREKYETGERKPS